MTGFCKSQVRLYVIIYNKIRHQPHNCKTTSKKTPVKTVEKKKHQSERREPRTKLVNRAGAERDPAFQPLAQQPVPTGASAQTHQGETGRSHRQPADTGDSAREPELSIPHSSWD